MAPRDGAPGSHLARRRGSDARLEAVGAKRPNESGPPTKPSIAPPPPRPNAGRSPLGEASPLVQLERSAPTLTYGVVISLAVVALAIGGVMAAWSGGRQGVTWLAGTLWFAAISTLIFSSSMALVITLSFTRRLRVLAEAAARLSAHKDAGRDGAFAADALTSLALSVTRMAERIAELAAELAQRAEREEARIDELVRERTRALSRENDDYKRMLGETRGLLALDKDGRVLTQSSLLDGWFGSLPRTAQFWACFERASVATKERFEAAWARATDPRAPSVDLSVMPTSLVYGRRHFALEYKSVLGEDGRLQRVLVLLTDVTIPEPDVASPADGSASDAGSSR